MFAPLSESGDYTAKYYVAKNLIEKYNPIKTRLPEPPKIIKPVAYPTVTIEQYVSLSAMLKSLQHVQSEKVLTMEKLNIYNNSGQNFGYVVYRKTLDIPAEGVLHIEGRVCDTFMVLVNDVLLTPWLKESADLNKIGSSNVAYPNVTLSKRALMNATVDIVVENWGRVNIGDYNQPKGLCQGQVKLNDDYIYNWDIYPLEFKTKWTNSLTSWKKLPKEKVPAGPGMYKAVLTIADEPKDTFVDMENWMKGIVAVNGFVIGRYARMGPVQTLYLPAPFLKKGDNDIAIFEHFKHSSVVKFSNQHIRKLY